MLNLFIQHLAVMNAMSQQDAVTHHAAKTAVVGGDLIVIERVPSSRCGRFGRTSMVPQLLLLPAHLPNVDLAPKMNQVASKVQSGLTQLEGVVHVVHKILRIHVHWLWQQWQWRIEFRRLAMVSRSANRSTS